MAAKTWRKRIAVLVLQLVLLGLLLMSVPGRSLGAEADGAGETASSAVSDTSSDAASSLMAQGDDSVIEVTEEGGEKAITDYLSAHKGSTDQITFRLMADVSVTETITIAAGQTVLFELNDYRLMGNGFNGPIIHVQKAGKLTITDGLFGYSTIEGGNNSESGGGIVNEGTLTITGTAIQNCHSDKNGGGLYNAGTLQATNLYVLNNTAQDNGGGIYNANLPSIASYTNATIEGGLIEGNKVLYDGLDTWNIGQGGGVYNNGEMILRDVTIRENTSVAGGGFTNNYDDDAVAHMSLRRATATISHCVITKNNAHTSGGGIFVGNGYEPENYTKVAVTIEKDTRITNNLAGAYGGGIYASSTTAFLLDSSSVTDNVSHVNGGGIYLCSEHPGQLHLKGKVVVRDNGRSIATDNVYLSKTEESIVIDGALADGSYIGFLTDWGKLQIRQLSNGYSDKMGSADPASYFYPDAEGYSAFYKEGEVWYSEDVPYIDYVDGVRTPSVRHDYKVISVTNNKLDNLNSKGRLESGWYVCTVQAKVQERVWLYNNADVHLILVNGCNLHLEHGLAVVSYRTSQQNLSIYGQEGDGGEMYAGTEGWGAGIGGVYNNAQNLDISPGNITIYGGNVFAEGNGGAGIGTGYYYQSNPTASRRFPDTVCGSYTQWGGIVTAKADASRGSNDAGLGGGGWCANMPITINGGTLTAIGGNGAAGIGAGYAAGLQGDITINGGHVKAIGGNAGVGIGWCGMNGSSQAKLIIRGGTVETSTLDSANAIHHKADGFYLCGGTVTGSSKSTEQIVASKDIKYGVDPYDATYKQGYRVLVGSSASDAKPVLAAERGNACNNTAHDHSYVCLEPCTDHEYTYDKEAGTATCKWCGNSGPYHTVTYTPGIGTGETTTKRVIDGVPFTLPTAEEAGYSLSDSHDYRVHAGWKAEGDDTVYHLGAETTVTKDTTFVAQWSLTWAELQELINELGDKETLWLPCDVTATATDQALVIPAGKHVKIDLNGFALNRNLSSLVKPTSSSVSPGSVFVVEGTLTLNNGSSTGGTVTGGYATTGGGVYVADGGTFINNAGFVTKNTATTGGGVYVAAGGTCRLVSDGITENAALKNGGGAYVEKGGTLVMSAPSLIYNNDAANRGGGVYVAGGTFTHDSGYIKSNKAKGDGGGVYVESGTYAMNAMQGGCGIESNHAQEGGGVYVHTGATYQLGGYFTMADNTVDSSGGGTQTDVAGNIYLQTGVLMDVVSTFYPTGTVGVRVQNPPYRGGPRVLTDGLDNHDPYHAYDRFTSENDGYLVGRNTEGEAILGASAVVSFDAGKGVGEMDSVEMARGSVYELPDSDFIAPVGLDFLGWKTDNDTELHTVGSTIVIPGNVTLTAQYGKDYDLWVNGVQVTSGNCQDVLGDGTVVYAPKTNTLHLDNPTITDERGSANIFAVDMDLTVTGTATLDTGALCGIFISRGSLTLDGDFTIVGGERGVYANNITIAGGTVTAEAKDTDSGFGLAVNATEEGGIVIEDGVERVEVKAAHPLYARDKSISLGDSLYIEEPVGGAVFYNTRFAVARIVDAEGNELDHVVIAPYHIEGKKTWADSDKSQTASHSPITVRLLGDGTEVASATVSEADGWAWSFAVPYASEGRSITYTLTEDAKTDYVAEVDGFDVTNTYQAGKTYVSVTAAWDDDSDRDGVRPASTVVRLLANGTDTGETLTLSADNNWAGMFSGLPTKKDGKDLTYTVVEDAVAQYEASIAGDATKGFVVTNTHAPATVDVTVGTVWDDADDQDGKRPDHVVVYLLADGTEIGTAVLTAQGGWTHTFAGLLKNADGKAISYTLTADAVPDYTAKVAGDAADGLTVTNTHAPETKTVEAVKTWVDDADADSIRPESVTLTLTGTVTDDEGVTTKVYAEAASTTDNLATWTAPVYHAGKAIDYTVAETDATGTSTVPEGYEATVSDLTVTNTHTPEKVPTAGTLTWDDADNSDGVRPSSVTVRLLGYGEELDSQVVEPDANGVWAWDFGERNKRVAGEEIDYTVEVDEVEGYTFTQAQESLDITGTHQRATVDLGVTISWEDDDNRDGVRPKSATIHVLGAGAEVASATVSLDGDAWSTTFTDLPKNAAGKAIVYTVTEDELAGYESSVSMSGPSDEDNTIRAVVTNTHAIEKVDVTGTITWDDDSDRDGIRPPYLMMSLLYEGLEHERLMVRPDDDGNWTFTFHDQPKYEAGQLMVHELSVDQVRGYTFVQEEDSYDFVATHTPETIEVKGSKIWDDADNQDGLRPESVTVTLTGLTVDHDDDGGLHEVFSDTKTTANDRWEWTVPRYENGRTIAYLIDETDAEGNSTVPEGYEAEVDEYDIVNTHTPEMIDIEARKVWDDGDNQDGLRPKSVTVHLLAGDAEVASATLSEENDWKTSFTGLPKCAAGKEIAYTLSEDAVEGYAPTVTGSAAEGLTLTNTHTPEVCAVSGTVRWDDDGNRDGIRPESITVRLLADGTEVASQVVEPGADGTWAWDFGEQPVYASGVARTYTLAVDDVEGYDCEVDGFDATFTHEPAQVDSTVVIQWDDNNNQDSIRPDRLVVILKKNGRLYGSMTVSHRGWWTTTVGGLHRYENGQELTYEWEVWEVPEGYELSSSAVSGTTTTLTYIHEPETISTSVQLHWVDGDDDAGLRPSSVDVNLMRSGVVMGTYSLSADNDWSASAEDLPVYGVGKYRYTWSVVNGDWYDDYRVAIERSSTRFDYTYTLAGSTSFTVTKEWDDNDNQDGVRPESVSVWLLADNRRTFNDVVLNEDNGWTYTWEGLDRYHGDSGEISYSVTEASVQDYTLAASEPTENGAKLVNTHAPGQRTVSVAAAWLDGGDAAGRRPESLQVTLVAEADGREVPVDNAVQTLDAANGWSYMWKELPIRNTGRLIEYCLKEMDAPDGYALSTSGTDNKGFTVTGTLLGEVSVTKAWDDADDQDGLRPESLEVQLTAGGETTGDVVTLTEDEGWTATVTKPLYGANGSKIAYSWKESSVPEGYELTSTETVGLATTLTNTHEPETTEATVSAAWVDGNNRDGLRPPAVDVTLVGAGGKAVGTASLSEANGWTLTLNNLPKYDKGVPIAYGWVQSFDGLGSAYTASTQTEGTKTTFTNTHVVETVDLQVTKAWDDDGDRLELRPEDLEVELLSDGEKTGKTVTLDEAGSWTAAIENQPANEAGVPITYSWSETSMPAGYALAATEVDESGRATTLTNELMLTDAHVAIVWDDGDDADGLRPVEVVASLSDGSESSLTDEGGWKATKTDLPKADDAGAEIDYVWSLAELPSGYELTRTRTVNTTTTFTLTHVPDETSVSVAKVWEDKDDQDGLRPRRVTVHLLADGVDTGQKLTLSASNGWAATFDGLRQRAAGEDVVYTVTEDAVEGYTSATTGTAAKGFTLTNTHEPETIDVDVTKTWDDDSDRDGKRPAQLTVHLLANGSECASATLAEADDWKTSFDDLPKRAGGKEIAYTLTEDAVEGYTAIVAGDATEGFTVTNVHAADTVTVAGSLTWDDANNQDGLRPKSVTVHLLGNGGEVAQLVVKPAADGTWTWDFGAVPKNTNGSEIAYTFAVDEVDGYTFAQDGSTVTGTHEVEMLDVTVAKTWADADDQDGLRPEGVTVHLLANGSECASATLAEADGWKTCFEGLPACANGKRIVYTLTEDEVAGYVTVIEGSAREGFAVTNTHTPETLEIRGSKAWSDLNDQDGLRPESVTVTLRGTIAGEESATEVYADTVTTRNDRWSWTVPAYHEGMQVNYAITETDEFGASTVPAGYEATVSGFNITNTHTPATMGVSVTKVWDDADNQDGLRPESVSVELFADGTGVRRAILTEANGWKTTFRGMPERAAGKEIAYTLEEVAIESYSTSIEGSAAEGFTVTNTHTPETMGVEGAKTWDDVNDQDGMRPESVTVTLTGAVPDDGENVEVVYTDTMTTSDDSWQWTVPVYHAGRAISYSVSEADADGNSTVPEGYEATTRGYNITNTHVPGTANVSVTKVWDDADDEDGLRPEDVTVHLWADGDEIRSATLSEARDWKTTFKNLPTHAAGKEISYTLTEDSVEGYETTITGSVAEGFTVTNTHVPPTKMLSGAGSLTWDDDDNHDGLRPEGVTVRLLADGVEIASVAVTPDADGTWAWDFGELPDRAEGKKISYALAVDEVDGYVFEQRGLDLTGRHEDETVDVAVTKVWDDLDDHDGLRPGSVTVHLLADGTRIALATLTEGNGWQASFAKLPRYEAGRPIAYTLEEDEVKGYEGTVEGDIDAGFTVTNTHVPTFIDVHVAKAWDDDNHDGLRPEAVTVHLLANDEEVGSATLTEADGWAAAFEDMPTYRDGREVSYTLVEDAVEGYATSVAGSEAADFTVTNTHADETVSVTAGLVWDDKDNLDGRRPTYVTVRLLADGVEAASATLTEADGWQESFENLPKYADGVEVSYDLDEVEIEGYETTVTGSAAEGFTITGAELVSVAGLVSWDDAGNQDGKRPDSTTVHLLADGEKVHSVEVGEADSWGWSFDSLPKYANGKEISYAIAQEELEDHDVRITRDDDGVYTITNSHTPETVSLSVAASWDDGDDRDGLRPTMVVMELIADGTPIGALVLNDENGWTWTSDQLPKYAGGKEITYTVEAATDDVIAGEDGSGTYAATVTGDLQSGFVVTYTHTPAQRPEPTPDETHEITYQLNGGSYGGSTADIVETHTAGEKITIHAAPTRSGYTFLYWKGSTYQPGDSYTVTGDHTFTAQWKKNDASSSSAGGSTSGKATPTSTTSSSASKASTLPETGDQAPLTAWLPLSGLALLALGLRRRRASES